MVDRVDEIRQRRAVSHAARLTLGAATGETGNWKAEDTGYQAEFLSATHLLADMAGLEDDQELLSFKDKPAWVPLADRLTGAKPKWAVAASLMIVTVLGVGLFWQQAANTSADLQRHVTRVGEQKVINLDDGSVITLNTGSELLVSVTADSRKAILQRGEAYFDVVRDPDRPFTVDSGLRSISVLGTEFNVRKAPENLQLVVVEGMVAIHATGEAVSRAAPLVSSFAGKLVKPNNQYRVKAGWVAEFDAGKEQLVAYAPENLKNLHLWRTGILDFDGVSLVDVVGELNRYSGKKILIEDGSIVDLKVLAVMQVGRLDLALNGLEYTLPIKVTHHFDRIVLTSSK